jgi:hypothetical protein
MADILRNILSLSPVTPRYLMKTAFEVMLQSVDVLKGVAPGDSSLAWQEFQNKLQAFYLFEHVDSVLAISSRTNLNLEQMVEKTYSLGPFFSVWATEGVGHYYAYLLATGPSVPQALLSGHTGHLPEESLVPLHTGMGLALAEVLLSCGYDVKTLADNFVQLCLNNSRQEYWLAAFEALGLVVRNLYPDLIAPLDHHFSQADDKMQAYFWHGVGRGAYFAPANSVPYWSDPWQCFETSMRIPHELGRRNAVAGCAWAMTLVNLRQPEIIATLLDQYGPQLAADDAFANGVFSALAVWLRCSSTDSTVQSFCEYQPDLRKTTLVHLWETQVRLPGRQAFQFRNKNGVALISDLFRYQPLIRPAVQI